MKKIFTILYIVLFFTVVALADNGFNQFQETPLPGSSGGGVVIDTNCNQAKYFPVVAPLCKDSSTNLIYTGTGSAVALVGGGAGCTGNLCAITASANGISLMTAANYAAMVTVLGLTIGTNTQAHSANLDTFSGIAPTANAQSLLGDSYAQMVSALGLVIGSQTQAYSAKLLAIANLVNGLGCLANDGSGNFSYAACSGGTGGSGTILGSFSNTEYVIPMTSGATNTLAASQITTDSAGDLNLTTGAVVKINGVTFVGAGSDGGYGASMNNNTSTFSPTNGFSYGYTFIGGLPYVYYASGLHALVVDTPWETSNTTGTAGGLSGTPNIAVTNFTVSGVANITGSTWNALGTANVPAINRASGSVNIPTSAIGSNACVNATATATGIGVNDIPDWTFGGDYTEFNPPGLYAKSMAGATNTFTFKICNPTAANITPANGEVILWRDRL